MILAEHSIDAQAQLGWGVFDLDDLVVVAPVEEQHELRNEFCACGPQWDEPHEGRPLLIHNNLSPTSHPRI